MEEKIKELISKLTDQIEKFLKACKAEGDVTIDEIIAHSPGWNGENETFVIISQHKEKSGEEITSMELARLAEKGGSFDFLSDPRENIYDYNSYESKSKNFK